MTRQVDKIMAKIKMAKTKLKKGLNVQITNFYYNKEFANKKGIITDIYHDDCILTQTTWIKVKFKDNKTLIIPKSFVMACEE